MKKLAKTNSLSQGIAFDLEGTLINAEDIHQAAHLNAAAELGITFSEDDMTKILPHLIGYPDTEVAKRIVSYSSVPIKVTDFLLTKKRYFERQITVQGAVPREGVTDFISWLKSERLVIPLAQQPRKDWLPISCDELNLLPSFRQELIVTDDDVPYSKPASDIYLETVRRMKIPPSQQLIFEDLLTGVRSAAAAGCLHIIGVPVILTRDYLESLRAAGAEKIFYSWEDPDLKNFVRVCLDL